MRNRTDRFWNTVNPGACAKISVTAMLPTKPDASDSAPLCVGISPAYCDHASFSDSDGIASTRGCRFESSMRAVRMARKVVKTSLLGDSRFRGRNMMAIVVL